MSGFSRREVFACCLAVCMQAGIARHSSAQGAVFALAGKSTDENFLAAWRACDEEARRHGDRCILVGGEAPSNFRLQNSAIVDALAQPLAGLAVSVTRSEYLAGSALALARQKQIPVVTFDSDLNEDQRWLRRSFIGPDNLEVGRRLGEFARKSHPNGGTVCLMSGNDLDPNLNQRLVGARQALSRSSTPNSRSKLQGEAGWRESDRCPLYNFDDVERALRQMQHLLGSGGVDVLISVGAWPLWDPKAFRAALKRLELDAGSPRADVIVAVGAVSEEMRALVRAGVVRGLVSLDFAAMGKAAYLTMQRLARGESVAPVIATRIVNYD
jgi:ribose transport system substrate-binding protein